MFKKKPKKIKISKEDLAILAYSLAEVWELDIRRLAKHLFKQEHYKMNSFELITDNNEVVYYSMNEDKSWLIILGAAEENKKWLVHFFRKRFLEEKDKHTAVEKNDANKPNNELSMFVQAFFLINIWFEVMPKMFKKRKGVYTYATRT